MAGTTPGRALGTRRGQLHKLTPHSLQQPRRNCEACHTPLYIREFRYCRQCRAHLNLYRALQDVGALL